MLLVSKSVAQDVVDFDELVPNCSSYSHGYGRRGNTVDESIRGIPAAFDLTDLFAKRGTGYYEHKSSRENEERRSIRNRGGFFKSRCWGSGNRENCQ